MIKKIFLSTMIVMLAVIPRALGTTIKDNTTLQVKPNNPNIAYIGRFTPDSRYGWPGSVIKFRFQGTTVGATFKLTHRQKSSIQVIINGKPGKILKITPKQQFYLIADDLSVGSHTVELWKREEGYLSEIKFLALYLNRGAKLLPVKRQTRRILIVGDSITCGFGNEATTPKEGNNADNENSYLAYGPVAARTLNSEIMLIAWSGRGVYRNNSLKNDTINTMPQLFDRTLPLRSKPIWDHQKYVPQLIVINLGTNDLSRGKGGIKQELAEKDFAAAYNKFLAKLNKLYPQAKFILAFGPMRQQPASQWLQNIAAKRDNAIYLEFPRLKGKEYFGAYGHPSVKMDRIMAKHLVKQAKQLMNW
ncbi:MAG: GDSL-type esterase/lipase family protein [Victivallaceae bacterium]|nr:GDSL-type esterase/lipase family protein [Victivallaceae bacterium]